MKKLEVIATSIDDVKNICNSNANRIELVSHIDKGGFTPSIKLIKEALSISSLPIRVMIRKQEQFQINDIELKALKKDIKQIANLKIDGIVIGTLNYDDVDLSIFNFIKKEFPNLKITFHRAFDHIKHKEKAINILKDYNVDHILTPGGLDNIESNIDVLNSLYEIHPGIMAGAGINFENISMLKGKLNCEWYHVGSCVRVENSWDKEIDIEKINELIKK